jgi:ribose transport system ATP-binding protein
MNKDDNPMESTMLTSTKTTILQMKHIYKSFPGVQALQDVNFDLYQGEIHGLVGKNGAGKSTLMAVLMGLQSPDAGEIVIGNHHVKSMTPNDAVKAGVAYVPQRVNLMDSLTVAENILAGQMPKDRLGFLNWSAAYREAERRLKELGLHLNVHSRVEGISVAEQTMLAIAKALFGDAKLIILDEPTAPLPRKDIDRLFSFVRSLRDRGVAFIYISHHMEEVFEICDRVTIMRDSCVVDVCDVARLTMEDLTEKIAGEHVKEYERDSTSQKEEVLAVKGLTRRGFYEDINLTVLKGEIVGISGLQGCGAETLGKGLFALEKWGIGEVKVNHKPFTPDTPSDAFDQGLAYLPQDRYRFGLVGSRTVRENITYPILYRFLGALGLLKDADEENVVAEFIRGLGIVTPSQGQMVRLLSGGNQQKVVFAKLAATRPSVLILHEPTQGIDVRAKQDIYRIIGELSAQGVSIVIISSEVRELIGVCDRILVMYEGRITHEFKKGDPETTPGNILLAIEGGDHDHGNN